ncbi:flagellar basal body M-ring protein FliF [Campylobacter hyointestinalis subsp. hyointestinalis]|uniref:flagellar basal-body MS-ring/collar protein FliF n=1 Tax=Campylobacter hyointestinalis TaxID=198 RepID=UPI0004D88493|nr:flagellar basal-body MS-ring/collar protein FliF [Campylobacter hyointestinalis]ANE31971.1 flagellar MS-ring protein [Campylobacter hyointestinalis subsp. hyointestinalis LMG 9260]KEA44514.1 flagellar M-ring protein FliF [Campylobacter hyointestinalis subsp. hyointestinalis]MBT0612264.1 flagellar M-ring protein FliF [Campylobacter hyointestinalis subsp. hyointestinalis]MDY2999572.1 flagellar basal-body MS-ring/collar protein FliF [Campylobacter hyointestinalis]PPB57547.1 flagellar M-ring pr
MDFKTLFHQVGQLYQNLTIKQKIVAASSIVVVVGFLVFLSLYKSSTSGGEQYDGYSVLFRNLNPADSAQIIDQLEKDGVSYKLANEGTILVPTKSVYKERIAVASLGIPKEGKNGFEIFDKQDFGATDNEQRVKFQRAIQGELARTIESLEPIQRATVYIAFPKDSVFTERQVPPTASVVVKIKDGEKLNRKQIDGIKRIVAGSVSNLKLEDVKIVTSDGVAVGEDEIALENELVAAQIKYKREFESSYEQKIIDMIGKFIGGRDKVTAKVSIEFDFSTKDSHSEIYDPNSVIRSEQNIEEKREGRQEKEVGGVPGAVSNIGPVQGLEDNKPNELYSKNVANTNYEISKKIIKVKDQYATIKRVTAAVVVDGKYENTKDENGAFTDTLAYVPLSTEELDKLKSLVEQTIGYDKNRGDEVTVSNFEFKLSPKSQSSKVDSFVNTYLSPLLPLFKYLIALIILFVFYKKVITPFLEKMLKDVKEDEFIPQKEDTKVEEETEDVLEKFKAARKKVEEQLGIGEEFNEDELKYEVLLEKMKLIVSDRSEEIANLLQGMIKNDSDFSSRKEF